MIAPRTIELSSAASKLCRKNTFNSTNCSIKKVISYYFLNNHWPFFTLTSPGLQTLLWNLETGLTVQLQRKMDFVNGCEALLHSDLNQMVELQRDLTLLWISYSEPWRPGRVSPDTCKRTRCILFSSTEEKREKETATTTKRTTMRSQLNFFSY